MGARTIQDAPAERVDPTPEPHRPRVHPLVGMGRADYALTLAGLGLCASQIIAEIPASSIGSCTVHSTGGDTNHQWICGVHSSDVKAVFTG